MPDPEAVTLAVISDLHCRLSTDANDSFLTVGGLRSPSSRHPVQALVDHIASERLHADALLVPGDLANRACVEGLGQGWDYALEIGRQLGVSKVIAVVGNHDVDSQRVHPDVPVFHAVQNLRPGFPFPDSSDVSSFFADGYLVCTCNSDTEGNIVCANRRARLRVFAWLQCAVTRYPSEQAVKVGRAFTPPVTEGVATRRKANSSTSPLPGMNSPSATATEPLRPRNH
jgi:hypothetical protein